MSDIQCHGSSIPSTSTAMATVTAASRLMHSVAHTRSQSLAGCFHHRPQHHRHFEAITRLTPTTRPLSFSSIFSPSRARAFALESYLSANPEDVDRYAELYAVWLESADKKSAQQVVDNYHRVTGLYAATVTANQAVLLKNDKMFDCYLAATAMLGKDIQARLAEAAQRRGAVMTHAEKQGWAYSTFYTHPNLTDHLLQSTYATSHAHRRADCKCSSVTQQPKCECEGAE